MGLVIAGSSHNHNVAAYNDSLDMENFLILLIDIFMPCLNYDFPVEPTVIKPKTHLTLSLP